jgi:hypothetical protein
MTTDRRTRTALTIATASWSAGCAALGLWWSLDPDAYLLDGGMSAEPTSLIMVVPAEAAAAAFLALGLLGIVVAIALGRLDLRTPWRGVLLTIGAVYGVTFAVLVPDAQVLAILGYALALLGPPILVLVLAAGARRSRWNVAVLVVIGTAVAVGAVTGQIGGPTLALLEQMRDAPGRTLLRALTLLAMLLGGLLFAAHTAVAGRRSIGDRDPVGQRRAAARLHRWGRVATWIAAISPMPYVLIRATWLTPWPLGAPGGDSGLDSGIRLFGLLLGLAAVAGAALTLGLVYRWGEVWPDWLPALRGRPVPVLAAVIPAAVVSVALCAAAISLVVMSTQDGAGWLVFAIPAPVWGPALALATYAYYRRRTHVIHDSGPRPRDRATAARSRDHGVG